MVEKQRPFAVNVLLLHEFHFVFSRPMAEKNVSGAAFGVIFQNI